MVHILVEIIALFGHNFSFSCFERLSQGSAPIPLNTPYSDHSMNQIGNIKQNSASPWVCEWSWCLFFSCDSVFFSFRRLLPFLRRYKLMVTLSNTFYAVYEFGLKIFTIKQMKGLDRHV